MRKKFQPWQGMSLLDVQRFRVSASVPFCNPHRKMLEKEGKHIPFNAFDKWHERGSKSSSREPYKLYWKCHEHFWKR